MNIGTRYRLLDEHDIRQAFTEASAGKPVVMAFTNHDFRNMAVDINMTRDLLRRMAAEFPDEPAYIDELAYSIMLLGFTREADSPTDMQALHRRAVALWEKLVASFYRGLRYAGARRAGPWSALLLEKRAR